MSTTLSDFCAAERQHVIDFMEWYTQCHRMDPEKHPLSLPVGVWIEQREIWDEGNG